MGLLKKIFGSRSPSQDAKALHAEVCRVQEEMKGDIARYELHYPNSLERWPMETMCAVLNGRERWNLEFIRVYCDVIRTVTPPDEVRDRARRGDFSARDKAAYAIWWTPIYMEAMGDLDKDLGERLTKLRELADQNNSIAREAYAALRSGVIGQISAGMKNLMAGARIPTGPAR